MFKHLLVPVDGSDVSKKALKKVAQLASAEMGWSLDTQQLYIGNGTTSEVCPIIFLIGQT